MTLNIIIGVDVAQRVRTSGRNESTTIGRAFFLHTDPFQAQSGRGCTVQVNVAITIVMLWMLRCTLCSSLQSWCLHGLIMVLWYYNYDILTSELSYQGLKFRLALKCLQHQLAVVPPCRVFYPWDPQASQSAKEPEVYLEPAVAEFNRCDICQ